VSGPLWALASLVEAVAARLKRRSNDIDVTSLLPGGVLRKFQKRFAGRTGAPPRRALSRGGAGDTGDVHDTHEARAAPASGCATPWNPGFSTL